MSTPQPPKKPTPGEAVAQAFVDALKDPDFEKKEAAAKAEREQKFRESLIAQGVLKKDGGTK